MSIPIIIEWAATFAYLMTMSFYVSVNYRGQTSFWPYTARNMSWRADPGRACSTPRVLPSTSKTRSRLIRWNLGPTAYSCWLGLGSILDSRVNPRSGKSGCIEWTRLLRVQTLNLPTVTSQNDKSDYVMPIRVILIMGSIRNCLCDNRTAAPAIMEQLWYGGNMTGPCCIRGM